MLNNRYLSLRHEKVNAIFKFQNMITDGFREFLKSQDFTEINTPKIVKEGAEEHSTNRHLNEYISLDLEFVFIEDEFDIMAMKEKLLKFIIEFLKKNGKEYLDLLQVKLPEISNEIPKITFEEAIKILKENYNKNDLEGDLDPEGEKLLYSYAKEKFNSEFIFITNYPRRKRPMYTMPNGENGTHSFDLLFRGIEITTGGQRIHNYEMLIENMKYKGVNPSNYESYLEIFKYGMPKHGGFAIGLERITSKILGIDKNIHIEDP